MTGAPTHYDVLRLRADATDEEIRAAHKRLAAAAHPDRHPEDRAGAEARSKAINEAFAVLSDPEKRVEYDRALQESAAAAMPPGMVGVAEGVALVEELGLFDAANAVRSAAGDGPVAEVGKRAVENAYAALREQVATPEGRARVRGAVLGVGHLFAGLLKIPASSR